MTSTIHTIIHIALCSAFLVASSYCTNDNSSSDVVLLIDSPNSSAFRGCSKSHYYSLEQWHGRPCPCEFPIKSGNFRPGHGRLEMVEKSLVLRTGDPCHYIKSSDGSKFFLHTLGPRLYDLVEGLSSLFQITTDMRHGTHWLRTQPGQSPRKLACVNEATIESKIVNPEILEVKDTALVADSLQRLATKDESYSIDEIVITATRVPQTLSQSPSSITVVSHKQIEERNGSSLANVVSSLPGVFVKEYGASSGLKTIAQRGLGAEHTIVLLNGIRISSFQNGLVDLGLIPVDEIERVEVLQGGHSAAYGADALAGVINVVTRTAEGTERLSAGSSFGSWGYRAYRAAGSFSSPEFGIRGSYGEEKSTENFPFLFHNGNVVSELERRNADYHARFGNIHGSAILGGGGELSAYARSYTSERGVGGPVVSLHSANAARQSDHDHILQLNFSQQLTDPLRLRSSAQAHYSYLRYRDPNIVIGGVVLDNYFKNNDLRFSVGADYIVNETSRIYMGSEVGRTFAEGNGLTPDIRRSEFAAFVGGEFWIQRPPRPVSSLVLYPAFRYDRFSSSLSSFSPYAGALLTFSEFDVEVVKHIRPALRAAISKNFRAPTFNELYYSGGGGRGNQDLRPERSIAFECGGNLSFRMVGEHFLRISYFLIDVADRIVWVPAGGATVTPKNIREVRSHGFENSYSWHPFREILAFEVNYTSLESIKRSPDYQGDPNINTQLIYVPHDVMNLSLALSMEFEQSILQMIGGTISEQFVGFRYYSEDNSSFIPSYRIVNVNFRGQIGVDRFSLMTKLEMNNVFNEDYQVIIGYPMPLRTYRLTLGVEF